MSSLRIEFQAGSPYLPELGLWLDAHQPQTGAERVFVSHAHSDHVAEHREVILSAPTAKLMQVRLGGARCEHILPFGEKTDFGQGHRDFSLTLLPAGHIFGSAMSLVEADGQSLLYTGDFKLRRGLSAESCSPRQADILIMETTYGRPRYVFPPTAGVLEGVIRFCREALDNDETAVLLGYSLGKSQELLCGLGDAGLPIMLHGAVYNLTQIYEQFGQCFPKYERYEAGSARGKVLLCPPNVINSAMLRNLGRKRTAILTGWAVDPNCRFRYQCDAAFPLSDHADFSELLELVKQVQPKKVYTLHGFAADFAQTLRQMGYDAQSLSQQEQFSLALGAGDGRGERGERRKKTPTSKYQHPTSKLRHETETITHHASRITHPFLSFAHTCSQIASDARKLEKVRLLAEHLRTLKGEAIALTATWFSGRPFPPSQNKVMQLGWAVLRDALCAVGHVSEMELQQIYLKHSDLGETAGEVFEKHQVESSLSVEAVHELFQQLHAARGPLAKTPVLTAAFEQCTALEAKYLVKIITGDLRIGLKEGLVEEAIASAFSQSAQSVRQTNLLLGDLGETAKFASENRLGEAAIVPFRPIKFMLASPEETAADICERMLKADGAVAPVAQPLRASSGSVSAPEASPTGDERLPELAGAVACTTVWLEDKYDGIRCQLHKVGQRVALYSRDLKEITTTFLELADAVRNLTVDFILDGEIVPMRDDQILPFGELQKRLGRRQGDLFMGAEVPIKYVAFDLLWLGGASCLGRPLRERRQALEALGPMPPCVRLARITQASSAEEIEAAFTAARGRNNEGLMVKSPASFYTPGRRGLAWLKLKKALATLDCVVVGAEYGHGKRNKVLSDYTFAVRDEASGELRVIGKAYTGLTDVEIEQMTQHFFRKAIRQHGRYFEVEPDTVLEIAFDKIQASDRHSSGLALRFPRIVRIRTDKSPEEIDTLQTARKLAGVS